ncbi:NUDIX domain-containing protein [Actinorugispora endophytica]|uniref:ADP-ribose pyrophosphatase YjhB (NUDIX family) n=1 Tax=Actinorugispora endophytica TaxID=1605990 RepID=A0A4R6UU51_9ACTN|nr:NUDIX domain-containing protein [Actinorugispora endophytica]TDQ50711.1 ADP-ribose pyrophosphatase YjhB (NUDIX family) [Actinorugispora endophytica]
MTHPTGARPMRRVTAHLLPTTPDGHVHTPLTNVRIAFGDDPAARLRTAARLAPHTPLTPVDVRTDLATVHHHGHPAHIHVDRLYYTAPAPDETTGDTPPLTLEQALALPGHPTPRQLADTETAPPRSTRRFAAYGLVTDPAGRLLLSKIASGYPGEGTWHLPGGGVDHGETARAALIREISEESDQNAHTGAVISIAHHHRTHQNGPHTDLYAVWVFLHAHVPHPGTPRVTETDGSTIDAAWFTPQDLPHLRLSITARRGLTSLLNT